MDRTRDNPASVFTPRGAWPNPRMYVDRAELEEDLKQSLTINTNVVIRGESGCGKSWLYKKVLNETGATYAIINLAQARAVGSIAETVYRTVAAGTDVVVGGRSGLQGGLLPSLINLVTWRSRETKRVAGDPVVEAARLLRQKAHKDRLACFVFDNFEQITDDTRLVRELASVLMQIDTPDWAMHNVHNVIVGTPSNMREFFGAIGSAPIQNRIRELPEVTRLTYAQAKQLILAGFVDNLGYALSEIMPIVQDVTWMADRVPQHVHSLCLEIAFESERKGRRIDSDVVAEACRRWLQASESSAYVAVARLMQVGGGVQIQRRNQALYALAHLDRMEFTPADVERHMRVEFPRTTNVQNLGGSGFLRFFAEATPPIIAQSNLGGGLYRFTNPIYRVCLRVMLYKDDREQVGRLESPELSRLAETARLPASGAADVRPLRT